MDPFQTKLTLGSHIFPRPIFRSHICPCPLVWVPYSSLSHIVVPHISMSHLLAPYLSMSHCLVPSLPMSMFCAPYVFYIYIYILHILEFLDCRISRLLGSIFPGSWISKFKALSRRVCWVLVCFAFAFDYVLPLPRTFLVDSSLVNKLCIEVTLVDLEQIQFALGV